MGYSRVKNNKGKSYRPYGPSSPITQQDVDFQQNLKVEDIQTEPAEVIDIVLNTSHPNYDASIPDPEEQIGTIQVRRLFSDANVEDVENLSWAVPLTRNFKQYPLIHEIVLVTSYCDKSSVEVSDSTQMYYHDILNMWGSIHHNALPFLSISNATFLMAGYEALNIWFA